MPTFAEKYGCTRPRPETMEVKTRFGITSDFCLSDKGYNQVFNGGLFCIYRKGLMPVIQWRGSEWKRQRSQDFFRLHGCNEEEWVKMSSQEKQQQMHSHLQSKND